MSRARSLPFQCSAVISDVDGTLVADEKKLTPRAIAAAAELRANGIVFSGTSARPPRGLRNLMKQLAMSRPLICLNGGVIARSDFSIITERLLSPDIARHAVEMLGAAGT